MKLEEQADSWVERFYIATVQPFHEANVGDINDPSVCLVDVFKQLDSELSARTVTTAPVAIIHSRT